MSRYPLFQRESLRLLPIAERGHDLRTTEILPLDVPASGPCHPTLSLLAERIVAARRTQRPVVLMMGAHPIKLGLSRFLIDLIENNYITLLAMNGAGLIHDFELAMVGGTSENVARWITAGQFGLWQETSRLNDLIVEAARRGEGLGEGIGRAIVEQEFPWRAMSLAAAGWRTGTPITCHVGIGSDIIHSMPNCDGAALGQTSYTDFLMFASAIRALEGGVYLNVGTAVTGPEVYLKALSMARNLAHQRGTEIRHFTTAVFDLVNLPDNWAEGTPSKSEANYYYRPWKTILVRTVADGGESHYVQGDHRDMIPGLWRAIQAKA